MIDLGPVRGPQTPLPDPTGRTSPYPTGTDPRHEVGPVTTDDTAVAPPETGLRPVDHRAALDAIEQGWRQIAPLQGARLREAVRSTPEAEWRGRPRILLALAASHRAVGSRSHSAALPWFRGVAKAIEADPDLPIDVRAGYHVQLAATLRALGNVVVALEHLEVCRTLLETDTRNSVDARITLSAAFSLQLALVRIHEGDHDQALFALGLAQGLAEEHLSTADRVECLGALAYVHVLTGEFEHADECLTEAAAVADGSDLLLSSFGALAQVARLLLELERGAHTGSWEIALDDVRNATRGCEWEALGWYAEALVRFAEGRHVEALDLLGKVARLVDVFTGTPAVAAEAALLRAEVMLSLGHADDARSLAAAVPPTARHTLCPARVVAVAHLDAGEPQGALEALSACRALGDLHSERTVAHVHVLTAAALLALGDEAHSDLEFDRALLRAGLAQALWPFAVLPDRLREALLERAVQRPQADATQAPLDVLLGSVAQAPPQLEEPLSERELVIVRHLATGQTLGQIGAQLYISVNTVKSHVRSVYRKLGATSRREAMVRVRQLGLHDDD